MSASPRTMKELKEAYCKLLEQEEIIKNVTMKRDTFQLAAILLVIVFALGSGFYLLLN